MEFSYIVQGRGDLQTPYFCFRNSFFRSHEADDVRDTVRVPREIITMGIDGLREKARYF